MRPKFIMFDKIVKLAFFPSKVNEENYLQHTFIKWVNGKPTIAETWLSPDSYVILEIVYKNKNKTVLKQVKTKEGKAEAVKHFLAVDFPK